MDKLHYVELPNFKTLSPFISDLALNIHINDHHIPYEKKMIRIDPDIIKYNLDFIINNSDKFNKTIMNCARQIWNHNFYWKCLSISNDIAQYTTTKEFFFKYFNIDKICEAGMNLFGSGWVWLVYNNNEFTIISTPNGDIPHGIIIMNIDIWEHSYYIDHCGNKLQFMRNLLKYLINWEFIHKNLSLIDKYKLYNLTDY